MLIGPVRRWIWPLLAVICLLAITFNMTVIVYDRVPDVYETMHLERLGRVLALAATGDAAAWATFRDAAAANSPVLLQYSSLPMRMVAGAAPRAGAVNVTVWFLLLIVAAFGVAHVLAGDRAGLLAAFFTALTPGLYRFSRLDLVAVPMAALVALAMYLLLRSDGLSRRAQAFAFGAVCSLGTLMDISFLLYALLPATFLIAQGLWLEKPVARHRRLANIWLAAAILVVVTVAVVFPFVAQWLDAAGVGHANPRLDRPGFIDYLRLLVTDGLGPILALMAPLGMVLLPPRDRGMRTVFLWFFPPLLVLHAVFGTLTVRALVPLLPAGAVLAAIGIELAGQRVSDRRRLVQTGLAALLVLGAFLYDNLREDQTAFGFDSFTRRLDVEGMPRPRHLAWSVDPVVAAFGADPGSRKIVMLLDSPYSSLIQGAVWQIDPLADIDNFFEAAAMGWISPAFERDGAMVDYLNAADFILLKTGFNTDPSHYSWARRVNPKFAQRVFDAFYEVKGKFDLVDHFIYPEETGPVLLYRRRDTIGDLTPTPPGPSSPAPQIAPDPGA